MECHLCWFFAHRVRTQEQSNFLTKGGAPSTCAVEPITGAVPGREYRTRLEGDEGDRLARPGEG